VMTAIDTASGKRLQLGVDMLMPGLGVTRFLGHSSAKLGRPDWIPLRQCW
jgi:hypothetical protein